MANFEIEEPIVISLSQIRDYTYDAYNNNNSVKSISYTSKVTSTEDVDVKDKIRDIKYLFQGFPDEEIDDFYHNDDLRIFNASINMLEVGFLDIAEIVGYTAKVGYVDFTWEDYENTVGKNELTIIEQNQPLNNNMFAYQKEPQIIYYANYDKGTFDFKYADTSFLTVIVNIMVTFKNHIKVETVEHLKPNSTLSLDFGVISGNNNMYSNCKVVNWSYKIGRVTGDKNKDIVELTFDKGIPMEQTYSVKYSYFKSLSSNGQPQNLTTETQTINSSDLVEIKDGYKYTFQISHYDGEILYKTFTPNAIDNKDGSYTYIVSDKININDIIKKEVTFADQIIKNLETKRSLPLPTATLTCIIDSYKDKDGNKLVDPEDSSKPALIPINSVVTFEENKYLSKLFDSSKKWIVCGNNFTFDGLGQQYLTLLAYKDPNDKFEEETNVTTNNKGE